MDIHEKASTFEIRKMFSSSLTVLKKHYLSIALLCVLMFLVSNLSGFLAGYIQSVNSILSAFLAFCFILLYSVIGLSLFKVVLSILDREAKAGYSGYLPTTRELLRYLAAVFLIFFISLLILASVSLICLPFVYLGGKIGTVVGLSIILSALLTFLFFLRVAFYPFFILDREKTALQAIYQSYMITKGNVIKLFSVVIVFVFIHLLQAYASIRLNVYMSAMISVLNAFFVTPLYVVTVTVIYRQMLAKTEKIKRGVSKPC